MIVLSVMARSLVTGKTANLEALALTMTWRFDFQLMLMPIGINNKEQS